MDFRSAVYYPHTKIQSPALLKHSLLLWDRIEFITPDREYRPAYRNRDMQRAIEMIGSFRHPNDAEKATAHEHIMEAVTRPDLPPELFNAELQYAVYPEKFSDETWHMLRDLGIAKTLTMERGDRYPISEPAGLLVMSMLADSCAGTAFARTTDRRDAYAKLTRLMVTGEQQSAAPDLPHEVIVPLTLHTIHGSSFTLQDLLRFREREETEANGGDLKAIRYRYVDRIAVHVQAVKEHFGNLESCRELDRIFREDIARDLDELRRELGLAARTIAPTPVITTLLVGGAAVGLLAGIPIDQIAKLSGTAITTIGGGLGALAGAFAANYAYTGAARAAMQKHPMAYMYELERFR